MKQVAQQLKKLSELKLFTKFYNTEYSSLNDSNMIIQYLCYIHIIVFSLYAMFIKLMYMNNNSFISFVLIALGYLVFSLIVNKLKPSYVLTLFSIIFEISTLIGIKFLGTSTGIQYSLFALILLYFYVTELPDILKILYSAITFSTLVTISLFNQRLKTVIVLAYEDIFILTILNIIYTIAVFTVIVMFYYVKFVWTSDKLLDYTKKLETLSNTDALTGLKNRRASYEYINNLVADNVAFDIVMCDIDKFKSVNDTYGHDVGDQVLLGVTAELKRFFENNKSTVCRWGGEEFLIISEHNNKLDDLLRNCKSQIARQNFNASDTTFFVTMTFGVASNSLEMKNVDDFIKIADENLYKGKNSGRNVIVW